MSAGEGPESISPQKWEGDRFHRAVRNLVAHDPKATRVFLSHTDPDHTAVFSEALLHKCRFDTDRMAAIWKGLADFSANVGCPYKKLEFPRYPRRAAAHDLERLGRSFYLAIYACQSPSRDKDVERGS